jgi:cytoskeletal protein CcmA (bactofilin family)
MAFWNSKSKDKFEDVDSIAIPTERSDAGAVAVVVTTVRHATSVIAAGVVVNGSISAPGDVQIEGHVIGDLRCATAIVGKDGDVKGNVVAETATVRGRVTGNVRARTIQLASTGSVEGDLSHAVLIIEEGGVFEGRSKRAADPLSELALSAPTNTEAAATEPEGSAEVEDVAEVEAVAAEPVAEPEVVAANEKEVDDSTPGKNLDDSPRSGVADALGEKFAVAS